LPARAENPHVVEQELSSETEIVVKDDVVRPRFDTTSLIQPANFAVS
jgi:hypothetical protein